MGTADLGWCQGWDVRTMGLDFAPWRKFNTGSRPNRWLRSRDEICHLKAKQTCWHSTSLLGHRGLQRHIFRSFGRQKETKIARAKKTAHRGVIIFHHFWKSLFFSCSSHSDALKGITVYNVQSIGRKYLNLPIISKWDYKQKGKKNLVYQERTKNNWIMSVIYFSLFNIRSGTLHFTNRINMNITSSHKLAETTSIKYGVQVLIRRIMLSWKKL